MPQVRPRSGPRRRTGEGRDCEQRRDLLPDVDLCEKFKRDKGTIRSVYQRYAEKKAIDTKRFIWQQPVGAAIMQRIKNLDLIPFDIELLGELLPTGRRRAILRFVVTGGSPLAGWACRSHRPRRVPPTD